MKKGEREDRLPDRAVLHGARAFADQRAERHIEFLDAQPEERNEAFEQDHFRDQQRRIDSHDPEQGSGTMCRKITDNGRRARGDRRFDEFAVLQRQRLPAHHARRAQPRHKPNAHEQHDEPSGRK